MENTVAMTHAEAHLSVQIATRLSMARVHPILTEIVFYMIDV